MSVNGRASGLHVHLIGPSVLFLFLRLYEASVHLRVVATKGPRSYPTDDARLLSNAIGQLGKGNTNKRTN